MSTNFATYYKCALQVNPYSYSMYRGNKVDSSEEENYNNEVLKKCQENNIRVVGLADHGNIDSSDSLRSKLEENNIVVFPGFEIMSAEKIHMVCLFPPEKSNSELNRFLGALGLDNASEGNETSSKTCLDIAEQVNKQCGFWYAAHITSDNGILKLGKLNNIWKNPCLIAAQIPDSKENIDPRYKNIIKNTDPQYKRNKMPALINACDIEKPADLEKDTAVTLVKMSMVSFDSFKVAFKDPDSRVKLISEMEQSYQSCIKHMSVSGGYLDEMSVDFSDNLTTIIGGRGTGKSTIINFIRYALNMPIEKEQQKNYNSMIESNLGSSGKVELDITSNKHFGQSFKIIRRYKQEPVIKDNIGNVSNLTISDVLPTIEIYGQNEIVDVVNDSQKINKVVRRLFSIDKNLMLKKTNAYNKLVENGDILASKEKALDSFDRKISDLPAIQERLKFYAEAGLKDKLSIITKLSNEEGQFDGFEKEIPNEVIDIQKISLFDSGNEDLKALIEDIKLYNSEIERISKEYTLAVKKIKTSYKSHKESWESKKYIYDQEIKNSLKQIEGIQDKSSEEIVKDYTEVLKKVAAAEPSQNNSKKTKQNIQELKEQRKNMIEDYRTSCDESDQKTNKLLRNINSKKLNGKIRLSIKYRQQKQELIDLLKKIDGIGDKALTGIIQYDDFDVFTFVEDIRQGNEIFKSKYLLTEKAADKIITNLSENDLRSIEQLQLSDLIEIELDVNGQFKKLENLSKGQQCTAILNILLLDNKDPLIVDQPEDNLDNSFIANNLVETIRNNKIKRQYMFATHNANIPVFGDAELIIAMEEIDGQGLISNNGIGSIDSDCVRQHVIQILEGGPEAFRMREEKYGIK